MATSACLQLTAIACSTRMNDLSDSGFVGRSQWWLQSDFPPCFLQGTHMRSHCRRNYLGRGDALQEGCSCGSAGLSFQYKTQSIPRPSHYLHGEISYWLGRADTCSSGSLSSCGARTLAPQPQASHRTCSAPRALQGRGVLGQPVQPRALGVPPSLMAGEGSPQLRAFPSWPGLGDSHELAAVLPHHFSIGDDSRPKKLFFSSGREQVER